MVIIETQEEDTTSPYAWVVAYTTPDDPMVETKVDDILKISSSNDGVLSINDVYELQEWVAGNIEYQEEDPKYPNETLVTFTGNCYNKATLLYSMILHETRYDDDFCNSYLLLIDALDSDEDDIVKHTSVLTVFNTGIIISDTTIDDWAVPDLCVLSEPEDLIYNIVDGTTLIHYNITTAVAYDGEYQEFADNTGFYNWAEDKIEECYKQ